MNFIRFFSFLIFINVTTFGVSGESWSCPTKAMGLEGLQTTMENKLFGQHLVMKTVPSAITQHLANKDPKKALVISFHGTTGIGKTYVTEMIAKYIYGEEGSRSQFVHTFLGEYYADPRKLHEYKKTLKDFVVEKTKNCGRSLFIFSEIEVMQHGMFDVLKPYIDYHNNVEKVDYRKNIFIFLSNIGGEKIKELLLAYLNSGAAREAVPSNKAEEILSRHALVVGGFEKSHLIVSGLVDFFIPFLPLEKFQTRQCILEEFSNRNVGQKKACGGRLLALMDIVAEEVQYESDGKNLIALNGCKMLHAKVDMVF